LHKQPPKVFYPMTTPQENQTLPDDILTDPEEMRKNRLTLSVQAGELDHEHKH